MPNRSNTQPPFPSPHLWSHSRVNFVNAAVGRGLTTGSSTTVLSNHPMFHAHSVSISHDPGETEETSIRSKCTDPDISAVFRSFTTTLSTVIVLAFQSSVVEPLICFFDLIRTPQVRLFGGQSHSTDRFLPLCTPSAISFLLSHLQIESQPCVLHGPPQTWRKVKVRV